MYECQVTTMEISKLHFLGHIPLAVLLKTSFEHFQIITLSFLFNWQTLFRKAEFWAHTTNLRLEGQYWY